MSSGVRLQRLRDFTVQIRRVDDDAIVGSGFVVSANGRIVTCARVVRAATGVHPHQAIGKQLGIYFPQARRGEEKHRQATVAACLPRHDDDVALLQLMGSPPPLGPEQVAVLGTAERSPFHPFRSYGYRRLDGYVAGHAHGTILDFLRPARANRYRSEPLQLDSRQLTRGMSGAPVLDTKRNLVIGTVSEARLTTTSGQAEGTAWAVNSRVLQFDPFDLPVQLEDLPRTPAPQPRIRVESALLHGNGDLGVSWNNAPPPLREWVGRDGLLQDISLDLADPERSVTGLIGPPGEGKSSLARRWLDNLLEDPLEVEPDGVFWWSFQARPSVDEFFDAAFEHMSGGGAALRRTPSASVRARIIGAMLAEGRYLFVLDGLEAVQHQKGDQYGILKSADLLDFLSYFAASEHRSFCLITSHIPVLDLMEYSAYVHREVTPLSSEDGQALLRQIGVTGADEPIDKAVVEWKAHALTLSVLGAYLADEYASDADRISRIPPPKEGEARHLHPAHLLRLYDECLSVAERAFLTVFSAFRVPVRAWAFERVFRADMGRKALNVPIASLDETSFRRLLRRLVARRILRYCPRMRCCTMHPLIRSHYRSLLAAADPRQVLDLHNHIKDYYLRLAEDVPADPSIRDLTPAIEAVHHACSEGAYDQAYRIYHKRIRQGRRSLIAQELAAYETDLAIMLDFFPHGDTSRDPQLSRAQDKRFISGEVALCLRNLGRLPESLPFYERSANASASAQDWHRASSIWRTVVDLECHAGALDASTEAARRALTLAGRAGDKAGQRNSLYRMAWAAHLSGDLKAAGSAFKEAERLEKEINPNVRYLYGLRGVHHACHLLRMGKAGYAQRVMEVNLRICERSNWLNSLSLCHRLLGDLEAEKGHPDAALEHYDEALRIAFQIGRRDVLIDVLFARGLWYARQMGNAREAFTDLILARDCASRCGYYVHEADIRVALAWAHLATKNRAAARAQAERAQYMSSEVGYHWGQIDAREVLTEIDDQTGRSRRRR